LQTISLPLILPHGVGVGTINLSKPTFLILFLVIAGIGLTIGAASAVMMFTENLEVDNGAGDSSVKVTSATGDSKVIVEDQGGRAWSVKTNDGKNKFQITDETLNKPRFTIKKNGQVGIGVTNPSEKLEVNGNIKAVGNLDVGGTLTGVQILDGLNTECDSNDGKVPTFAEGIWGCTLINGPHIGIDAIDGTHINDNSIRSADINDGTIVSDDIAADAVGASEIAPGFMKFGHLTDSNDSNCEAGMSPFGWCPDGSRVDFLIIDGSIAVDGSSVVLISLDNGAQVPGRGCTVQDELLGGFLIQCINSPKDGGALNYIIFKP